MNLNPGQGGNPPGPAASDLRWKAARGRKNSLGLQHPEGVYPSLGESRAKQLLVTTQRRLFVGLKVTGGSALRTQHRSYDHSQSSAQKLLLLHVSSLVQISAQFKAGHKWQ